MSSAVNMLLLALLLVGTVSANSLMFYGSWDRGSCHISTDHVGCYMHPVGVCCNSYAPFCVRLMLGLGASSPGENFTQYFVHQAGCNLSNNGGSYCTEGGPGNTANCCIGMPLGVDDGSTCSGFWLDGDTGDLPHGWKEDTEGDRACMDPNYMSYNDGSGMKKIFLPNGSFQQALEAYNRKDFLALAEYMALEEVMGDGADSI